MAGYTNQQLQEIYNYIGFNQYITLEPEIVSSITTTQAQVDGGDMPDGALQARVLAIVSSLQNVDSQLAGLINIAFVESSASGSKINVARGDFNLRKLGRSLIQQLCIILGIRGTRADYYKRAGVRSYDDNGISFFPDRDD